MAGTGVVRYIVMTIVWLPGQTDIVMGIPIARITNAAGVSSTNEHAGVPAVRTELHEVIINVVRLVRGAIHETM